MSRCAAAILAAVVLAAPPAAEAAGRGTVLHVSRAKIPVVTFAVPSGWVFAFERRAGTPRLTRGQVVRYRTGPDRRLAGMRPTGKRVRTVAFLAQVEGSGEEARLRLRDGLSLPLGPRYRFVHRGERADRGDLVHGEQVRVRWRLSERGRVRAARVRLPASVAPQPPELPPAAPGPLPEPGSQQSPQDRLWYWGAMINGLQPSASTMAPGGPFDLFERRAGKRMSLIQFGQPWKAQGAFQPFPTAAVDAVRRHGSIPVLNWASWELGRGPVQPDFQSRDVAAGAYDAYLRQWAAAAKAWGHPFMLRLNHEMNGWWYPWGEGRTSAGTIVNGNATGDFVRAWRHVKAVFDSVGATNVTWLWTPNHMLKDPRYPQLSTLYPGDDAVGWTGLSIYNRGGFESPTALLTGRGTPDLANSYEAVLDAAPTKPMLLAEVGSVEAGDGGARKAAWLHELLTTVPQQFPEIRGFIYFDWSLPGFETVPVATSTASQQAFKQGISAARFVGNAFGALSATPVPRPSR